MDYRSAFIELIDQNGLDVLKNHFLVHSLLLDKIGNSIQDKALADAYYQLSSKNSIPKELTNLSFKKSVDRLNTLIGHADKRYSVFCYKESVSPLLFYLFPNEAVVNHLTKAKQVKVKIIKANNPKGAAIIQNPPQPVVVAPIVKPINNKQAITERLLFINMVCKKLIIKESNNRNLKILNKNGFDITKTIYFKSKKQSDEIKLVSKRKEYTVVVPAKKYKIMSINYSGKYLLISNCFHQSSLKELIINSNKGDLFAYCDVDTVRINQNEGLTNLSGRAKNIRIVSNKNDVECHLNDESIKRCEIITNDGDIDLEFLKNKVKPKINHIFTKVRSINGIYQLGNHKVNLLLKANNGKIKVR